MKLTSVFSSLFRAVKRRWIEFKFRGVDEYSRRPKLPDGWEWSRHFDATAFPTDLARGPRAVWVSVNECDENNGALTATIRIVCTWRDERHNAVAGALHGIDVFCQRASIRDRVAKTRRERWALAWANAKARVKRRLMVP